MDVSVFQNSHAFLDDQGQNSDHECFNGSELSEMDMCLTATQAEMFASLRYVHLVNFMVILYVTSSHFVVSSIYKFIEALFKLVSSFNISLFHYFNNRYIGAVFQSFTYMGAYFIH